MHSAPDQQVMNDAYDHALWLRRLESPLDTSDRQLCDLGRYVSQLLNALDAGQRNCDAVYNDLKAENAKLRERVGELQTLIDNEMEHLARGET